LSLVVPPTAGARAIPSPDDAPGFSGFMAKR
jgi:hypothetical protein